MFFELPNQNGALCFSDADRRGSTRKHQKDVLFSETVANFSTNAHCYGQCERKTFIIEITV